jgi:hypothetical protein
MKLKKVRRVLKFRQSFFLKQYIDKCTELRRASKNNFGKTLWKLFANAVFGKFIESTRNYLNVSIALDGKKCEKLISNPCFSNVKILSEDTVLIFAKQPTVNLNKAFPVGFVILENAKAWMYQQFYDVIRPKLGNCEVLMSDTDSFLIAAYSAEETNNLAKLKEHMDFSNYDTKHPMYSTNNENALGYFKDELKGSKMLEFCGLRSKSYAFKVKRLSNRSNANNPPKSENRIELVSKCKGVTKAGRKQLNFNNYKLCVQSLTNFNVTQHHIRSINHRVQTNEVRKICFSSFDDKRFLFNCAVHSVPYGSKRINEQTVEMCPLCKVFNPMQKRFL